MYVLRVLNIWNFLITTRFTFWRLCVSAFLFWKQRNLAIARMLKLYMVPGGTAWSSIAVSQKLGEIPELPLKRVKHQTYWFWLRDISYFWWFCCQFTRPYRNTQTYILKGGPNMSNISWVRQYLHVTASPDLYHRTANWHGLSWELACRCRWSDCVGRRADCDHTGKCSGRFVSINVYSIIHAAVWAASKGVCTNH